MLKKGMVFMVLIFVLFLAGCETTKGVGATAYGVGSGVVATAKGAVEDTKGLAGAVMALDDWIKDNLW